MKILNIIDKIYESSYFSKFLVIAIVGISILKYCGFLAPKITQVVLNDYAVNLTTGDIESLSATVLFSDNSTGHNVIWISNNTDVVHVDENGQITALSAGSAIITAQASTRRSTAYAECSITVTDPLAGYAIHVRRTSVENYVFISVQPEDDSVTQITLYAKAPSGKIYTPSMDDRAAQQGVAGRRYPCRGCG